MSSVNINAYPIFPKNKIVTFKMAFDYAMDMLYRSSSNTENASSDALYSAFNHVILNEREKIRNATMTTLTKDRHILTRDSFDDAHAGILNASY